MFLKQARRPKGVLFLLFVLVSKGECPVDTKNVFGGIMKLDQKSKVKEGVRAR